MKILSLTQPWATLVILGAKVYETRSWHTYYQGQIGIHASKGFPGWAREYCLEEPFRSVLAAANIHRITDLPVGVILGTVNLESGLIPTESIREHISQQEFMFGDYSDGRWAWKLSDPCRLATPIAARGALGLWEYSGVLEAPERRQRHDPTF